VDGLAVWEGRCETLPCCGELMGAKDLFTSPSSLESSLSRQSVTHASPHHTGLSGRGQKLPSLPKPLYGAIRRERGPTNTSPKKAIGGFGQTLSQLPVAACGNPLKVDNSLLVAGFWKGRGRALGCTGRGEGLVWGSG
jgi:hypothetical protein